MHPKNSDTQCLSIQQCKMIEFFHKYHILLHHSTLYYPQGNGIAESSNKSLVKDINKTLEDHKKSWDNHLIYALWANRVSHKISTGKSPFHLVYGKEAIFPAHLTFLVMKFLQESNEEPNEFSRRIN